MQRGTVRVVLAGRTPSLPRTFEARLAVIALAGLALRLLYAYAQRDYPVVGDALTFHLDAQHLADGHGFQRPFEAVPTAEHPPLHILLLALVDVLGGHGVLAQKVVLCFVGTGTVVALGVMGRLVAGARAGLIAAGIGALYPLLWVIDGSLMSETTYVLLITVTLIVAWRFQEAPSTRRALAVGAAIGLAALTRGEAVGLLVVLPLPLAVRSARTTGPRVRTAALMVGAFCVVIAPWTIRNLATFADPVLISTNGDNVFVGANCHSSYYGDLIGSWDFTCFGTRAPGDESQYSVAWRDRGLRYAREHAGRVPLVVGVRLLRQFDLYRPEQSVFLQSAEGRRPVVARWGIRAFWLLLPFGIAGAVLLRRRRVPLLVLAAPWALAVVVGATVYGSTRLRVAVEPALVVLAAVAVDALVARARGTAPSSTPASTTATSVSAGISQSQSMPA